MCRLFLTRCSLLRFSSIFSRFWIWPWIVCLDIFCDCMSFGGLGYNSGHFLTSTTFPVQSHLVNLSAASWRVSESVWSVRSVHWLPIQCPGDQRRGRPLKPDGCCMMAAETCICKPTNQIGMPRHWHTFAVLFFFFYCVETHHELHNIQAVESLSPSYYMVLFVSIFSNDRNATTYMKF